MSSNLLYSEIFEEFDKATTREARVAVLRKHADPRLKEFLIMGLNPHVKFDIEAPPYRPAVEPAGLNFAYLDSEVNKMYRFITNHPMKTAVTTKKQEQLMIVILEALHKDEADLLVRLLKKDLGIKYLTAKICKEAFPEIDIPV